MELLKRLAGQRYVREGRGLLRQRERGFGPALEDPFKGFRVTEERGEKMGSWKQAFPSKWLKASDLEHEPRLVTIKKITTEKLQDGGSKPTAWFREEAKGLILNKTNAKSIAKATGSDDMDSWVGKRIVLYVSETEMGGETVDCIRVRAPKPGAKLPPPPPPSEDVADEEPAEGYEPTDDDVPF